VVVGILGVTVNGFATVALVGSSCIAVSGADSIRIDVGGLKNGQALSYCYHGDTGERIRFVLARGDDGKVRSVLDARRQCFTYRKGYRLDDGVLVCRTCGNRYRIEQMTRGLASCVPVGLPHQEDANQVKIKVSDLSSGRDLLSIHTKLVLCERLCAILTLA